MKPDSGPFESRLMTALIVLAAVAVFSIWSFQDANEDPVEDQLRIAADFAMQGNYERAIEAVDAAIDLDPDLPSAYYQRGMYYAHQEQCEKAIEDYSKAIELDPNAADFYYERGVCYRKTGSPAKAMTDFQAVVALTEDPGLITDANQAIDALTRQ